MTLTEQDIDILVDAMSLWEKQHTETAFTKSMIGMLTGKRAVDPETGFSPQLAEGKDADRENAEVSILIKAKLIQMKRDAQSRYDRDIREGLVPNG